MRGVERLSAKEQKRHTGLSQRLWSQDQEGVRLFFQQKTIVTNVSRESSGWRPGCALSWGDCPVAAADAPRPRSQGAELSSWGTLKQEPRGIHFPLLLAPATYNHLHARFSQRSLGPETTSSAYQINETNGAQSQTVSGKGLHPPTALPSTEAMPMIPRLTEKHCLL